MGDIDDHERYAQAGAAGVSWAISGGQSSAAGEPNHLAASGIENIIGILEALEDGKLSHVDLIELNACYPGCVGGALAVENPFIAKARLQQMMRDFAPPCPPSDCPREDMRWEKDPHGELRAPAGQGRVRRHGEDGADPPHHRVAARHRLRRVRLPKCRAFAEDIVAGRAEAGMCLFSDKNDKDK